VDSLLNKDIPDSTIISLSGRFDWASDTLYTRSKIANCEQEIEK
jgi:hypothetical protein